MVNWFSGSGVRDCPSQFPHRYRRHNQDLAVRRLRQHGRPGGLDGNLLQCRNESDANTDSHSNGYCHRKSNRNADCDCQRNSYADTDTIGNATYADTAPSADSSASPVGPVACFAACHVDLCRRSFSVGASSAKRPGGLI